MLVHSIFFHRTINNRKTNKAYETKYVFMKFYKLLIAVAFKS